MDGRAQLAAAVLADARSKAMDDHRSVDLMVMALELCKKKLNWITERRSTMAELIYLFFAIAKRSPRQ